jgi:signal transduction histidine kinase
MSIVKDKDTVKLLKNIGYAMQEKLNISMSAQDLIEKMLTDEKQREDKDTIEKNTDNDIFVLDKDKKNKLINYLAMLRHSQHSLLYIAQNLSELCTNTAFEKLYDFQAVDINNLCCKLVDTVTGLTDSTGVTLSLSTCKTDVVLFADYIKLERMLLSLISNSFLNCSQGDNIHLSIEKSDDTVVLTVADTGAGISRQTLPVLFEDYLRDIDEYKPNKGIGLGISVADSIAQMHGGKIIIETANGKGTVVSVSLPLPVAAKLENVTYDDYGKQDMRNVLTAMSSVLDYKKYYYYYK